MLTRLPLEPALLGLCAPLWVSSREPVLGVGGKRNLGLPLLEPWGQPLIPTLLQETELVGEELSGKEARECLVDLEPVV